MRDVTLDYNELGFYETLVRYEINRRAKDGLPTSLEDLEKVYFGHEVGFARRAFQAEMIRQIPENLNSKDSVLLDYGCGGHWFKDGYWPKFSRVLAVDISQAALQPLVGLWKNVELCVTRNGLINIHNECDVVLSSSIVCSIHTKQAVAHVKCCYEALKPGGRLILTRVRAHNIFRALKSSKMQTSADGFTFEYFYSRSELETILRESGFVNIQYHCYGVWISRFEKLFQQAYRHFPNVMIKLLPRIFPFLKVYHMYTAEKPLLP